MHAVQTTAPAACCSTTNNASARIAATAVDYLEANRVQLVTQTPYPPGLTPFDFFLFPLVKQH